MFVGVGVSLTYINMLRLDKQCALPMAKQCLLLISKSVAKDLQDLQPKQYKQVVAKILCVATWYLLGRHERLHLLSQLSDHFVTLDR
jgi:hypothetical protein